MSVWIAGSCVFLTRSHSFFFLALSYFLPLHNAPGCSFVFPAPVLESDISPRSTGSVYWRLILETKIWVPDVLVAAGVAPKASPRTAGASRCASLCVQNVMSAVV